MSLLIDDYPLLVSPKLATIIGLNESIVLQQVHYWIEKINSIQDKDIMAKHYHDGRWWIYNTFEQWQIQFPFWSMRTIKRIISSLETKGILISDNYNKMGYDRTKWYSIDYKLLESLENTDSAKMAQSIVSDCHNGKCQFGTTNTIDYTYTSSKNTNYNNAFSEKQKCIVYSVDYVKKHIDKICNDLGYKRYSEDIQEIFDYYFFKYEEFTGKNHPRLNNNNLITLIKKMSNGIYGIFPDDLENYKLMIDRHFEIEHGYDIDWNINHFLNETNIELTSYVFY